MYTYLPYDPVMLLLGVYSGEMKAYGQKETRTHVFIAALFY